jgi:hypothetical protein
MTCRERVGLRTGKKRRDFIYTCLDVVQLDARRPLVFHLLEHVAVRVQVQLAQGGVVLVRPAQLVVGLELVLKDLHDPVHGLPSLLQRVVDFLVLGQQFVALRLDLFGHPDRVIHDPENPRDRENGRSVQLALPVLLLLLLLRASGHLVLLVGLVRMHVERKVARLVVEALAVLLLHGHSAGEFCNRRERELVAAPTF